MVLLVCQCLIFQSCECTALADITVNRSRYRAVAIIDGGIFHRLCLVVGMTITCGFTLIVWVREDVEAVAVEGKLVLGTVGRGQRSPTLQGAVVDTRFVAGAAIETLGLTDIGLGEHAVDVVSGDTIKCCSQVIHHIIVEQVAIDDVVFLVQFQRTDTHLGSLELRVGSGSLGLQSGIFRLRDGCARIHRLYLSVVGIGDGLLGDIGS